MGQCGYQRPVNGCCLSGHCDVHSRRPNVRLALLLANHRERMSNHVVAPREGLPVHLVVHVVSVGHALFERCAWRYSVCVEIVAYVTVLRSNISRRHQDLVYDVNDAIAHRDVCQRYRCVADAHSSVSHGECGIVAVQHGHSQAVGNCRGLYRSRVDVVGQDVDQCSVLLVSVEGGQIDPGCREGRVCWCEDRERAICLQCGHQVCLRQRCHQCIVFPCTLCGCWYVIRFLCRHYRTERHCTDGECHIHSYDDRHDHPCIHEPTQSKSLMKECLIAVFDDIYLCI